MVRRSHTTSPVTAKQSPTRVKLAQVMKYLDDRTPSRALFSSDGTGSRLCRARFRFVCILIALTVLQSSKSVEATDALEPIGVSTQARMRGGADVAVGDSALSQIDNPASLSLFPRGQYAFDAATQLAIVVEPWRGPIDHDVSDCTLIHLHNFGLVLPVDDRLTLGLAFHSKSGLGTRFKMRHLMIPFMKRRVGSDMKDVAFHINAAYKLTDKLSLGIGARAEVATCKFSKVLGPADLEFGRGYAYGGGFQVGLHYQARDDLSFGLGYRSPSWFGDLAGGDGEASLLGLLPIHLGEINIDKLRLPQKVTVGAAWDVADWFKLIGEARWTNYRNSTFHSTTVATNGLIDLRYPLPLGYRDQWAFMLGAEFKLDTHWTLGLGYHYATAPVPRQNLSPMCSVLSRHHATAGLRYETDRWWVGGGYILAFRESLRGPGYSRIPFGIDYGNSTMAQTQHSISIGFGFRW